MPSDEPSGTPNSGPKQQGYTKFGGRIDHERGGVYLSNGAKTTDTPCPNDGELVNFACWWCGWKRDPEERKRTVANHSSGPGHMNASEAFLAPRDDDPAPLLQDLKDMLRQHARSHPRHLQIQLGPSEVGHPCSRKLAQGLLEMPAVNAQYDPLPSYIGVAAHAKMEDAARLDNSKRTERGEPIRWIPEQKVKIREDLSGTCDLYDIETHTVIDYKFPGTTAMTEYRKNGPSRTYRVQAHLYGAGYRRLGLPVERVGIWFLPRGGQLATSVLWQEDYNQAIVDATLAHIDNVMILAQELDVDNHPERWQYFPRTASQCSYCPYFAVSQNSSPCACPGAGPVEHGTAATT